MSVASFFTVTLLAVTATEEDTDGLWMQKEPHARGQRGEGAA